VATDGTLWFATSRGLARWDDAGLRAWGTRDGLPYRIVYSVATRGEHVLAGTAHGLGVFDGSAWTTHRMGPEGLSDDWVSGVAFGADGTPMAGTYDAGVDALDAEGPRPISGLGRLWVNPGGLFPVSALGGVFVTTLGDGLWFLPEDGEGRRWDEAGDLPSNDVTSVAVFEGGLFVGTRGGLARLSIPLAR
jgi:ligand-binding sensor domain-containing protein